MNITIKNLILFTIIGWILFAIGFYFNVFPALVTVLVLVFLTGLNLLVLFSHLFFEKYNIQWSLVLIFSFLFSATLITLVSFIVLYFELGLIFVAPLILFIQGAGLLILAKKEGINSNINLEINFDWPLTPLLIFLFVAGLIIFAHSVSELVNISCHGTIHSSLVYQIMNNGVPAQNPAFAGEIPKYNWPFHALIAGLIFYARKAPTQAILFFNIFSIFGISFLVYETSKFIFKSKLKQDLTTILSFFSLNFLGPVILFLSGIGVFEKIIRPFSSFLTKALNRPFSQIISRVNVSFATVFNQSNLPGSAIIASSPWERRISSFVTKFFTINSVGLSLLLSIIIIYGLFKLKENKNKKRARRFWLLLIILSSVMVVHIHSVTALAIVGSSAFVILWLLFSSGRFNREFFAELCLGYGAMGITCLPFFLSTTQIGESYQTIKYIGVRSRNLVSLGAAWSLLWIFAALFLKRNWKKIKFRIPLILGAFFILFYIFVHLKRFNEYKAIFLLSLPLSIILAHTLGNFIEKIKNVRTQKLVIYGLIGILLINPLLTFYAYFNSSWAENPDLYRFKETQIEYTNSAVQSVVDWIKENTEENSAFIVDPMFMGRFRLDDGSHDYLMFPALTRRAYYIPVSPDALSYATHYIYYKNWEQRRMIAQQLVNEGEIVKEKEVEFPSYSLLKNPPMNKGEVTQGIEVNFPLYVLLSKNNSANETLNKQQRFRKAFENNTTVIYKYLD